MTENITQKIINPGDLEIELTNIISKIVNNTKQKIDEENSKLILNEIEGKLDELVSKHVKKHFVELSKYILENFK